MQSHYFAVLFFAAVSVSELPEVRGLGNVIVSTKNGDIRGQTCHTAPFITKVNRFLGIPFAAPPVGELRFQAPRPAQPWKPRIHNATSFGNICMQASGGALEQFIKLRWPSFTKKNYNEDCLYLNVYAPTQNDSLNPTTEYPVMVYIHGGGFDSGTALLNSGLVLAQYGVVVVAIQYRLGALGFMTTGDSAALGNYGMLDQVQALKWVKENVNSFGGDPNKITIFGLSAGGASVALHIVSPRSNGLFHGAISESGVDLAPWSIAKKEKVVARTMQLASRIGCQDSDSTKLIDCLRTKDAKSFVDMQTASLKLPWAPIVDQSVGENAFLPDYPRNLRKSGRFNRVPFIAGVMTEDGAHFLAHLSNISVNMSYFRLAMRNYAIRDLNATKDKELISRIQNALEFQYTPRGKLTADSSEYRKAIADVLTDSWFVAPTVRSCLYHSLFAPTYFFEFNYLPNFSRHDKWMGPTHADNSVFNFGVPFLNTSVLGTFDTTDKNVSHLVMRMYTNFAKLRNPTPEPLSNGVQWTAFNSTNLAFLRIQPEPALKRNIHSQRVAFWNVYHPQLLKSARACNNTKVDGSQSSAADDSTSLVLILSLFGAGCVVLILVVINFF